MNAKTVKELKEKIEAEAKEDFDFEQHLFKKYPSLFYTGEDGELLPQFQRCWNNCPKGWELIVDHLCGSIVNYIENTSGSVINPNKKIMRFLNKHWCVIRQKIHKKFSIKVRRVTSKISYFFSKELYIHWEPPTVKVAQYKEKYGGLRFYIDGGDENVQGMIRFAEYLCGKTCQDTGEAGDLCKKGSWYATLSPAKEQQLGFSTIKEQ
jgi:hypothetical protein